MKKRPAKLPEIPQKPAKLPEIPLSKLNKKPSHRVIKPIASPMIDELKEFTDSKLNL